MKGNDDLSSKDRHPLSERKRRKSQEKRRNYRRNNNDKSEDRVDTIIEVVIFHVKPQKEEEFKESMKMWLSHIKEQPGFVTYTYLKSVGVPGVIIQILEFQYKFIAQDVLKKYKEKIGDEKFHSFFHMLHKKPVIEYYEKMDFINEKSPGEES